MEKFLRRWLLVLAIPWWSTGQLPAQSLDKSLVAITLEECYAWADANYPLIAKLDLLEKSTQFNLSNAQKGYLPQININGQATYQSEVTELPVEAPGLEVPTIDKDQYKIYGEIYQPLTNFSTIAAQKEQIALEGELDKQSVEVDMYQLRDRINQIYFGILLMDAKLEQLDLIRVDLDSTLARLTAAVDNGTATLMDQQLLEVEQLSIEQQIVEAQAGERAFRLMLASLTGQAIDATTRLNKPAGIVQQSDINRPELRLFALQKQLLGTRLQLMDSKNIPQLGLFVQGGYGRPALNFLSNEFTPYYIGGLTLSWDLSNFYTNKNDRQQVAVQQQIINSRQETFLLNTALTQTQQSQDVTKYQEMIRSDEQAVALREQIKTTAEVQLVNGLITTIDYIKILNDASRAQQQLRLHELQLLQSQYNLKTTTGF